MRHRWFAVLVLGVLVASGAAGISSAGAQPTLDCFEVAPEATGPEVSVSPAHFVCPPAGTKRRNRLLVFFPGTGGQPRFYREVVRQAARDGMYAIGLSYPNAEAVNKAICPGSTDPDCHEHVRAEIVDGTDASADVEVGVGDSIQHRLTALLQHLDRERADEKWDRFLDGGSERATPKWSKLVLAGHSQGGGHAFYIATQHRVARVVVFAWIDAYRGALAPWITADMATPAKSVFFVEHVQDSIPLELRRELRRLVGLDAFGPEVDVSTETAPYGGTHQLMMTAEPAREDPRADGHHGAVVVDFFTPRGADGRPVLADAWRYALGTTAQG